MMTDYEIFEKKYFKIKYPRDWKVLKDIHVIEVIFQVKMPYYASNVKINIIYIDGEDRKYSLDELVEANIGDVRILLSNANNFVVSKRIIAKTEARVVTYNGERANNKLCFLEVIILSGERLHMITYTAEDNLFHENLDIVNEMIDSYEIL